MDIKYIGENALQYIINKCKSTFALLTHTHTADEVGADASGSAAAALGLAEQYTDEQISNHTHTVSEISDLTPTATELNYMDGVTSNVQAQLDEKAVVKIVRWS